MTTVIRPKAGIPTLITLAGAMLVSSAVRGAEIDAFWLGGNESWSNSGFWDIGQIPNNSGANTFNVFIDGSNATPSVVTLGINATVSNLAIDADDSLIISNGERFRVEAGVINNAGTITLNSSGSNTYIHPRTGPVTLMGGGEVVLTDFSANWIYQENGGSFINVDNTIRGAGRLGWSSAPTQFTNGGLIVADGVNPLEINTATQAFTNDGTLRAENGATLSLNGSSLLNTEGTIEALDESTVTLNSVTIHGGMFQTSGTGAIESGSTVATINGSVDAVTNAGLLRVPNGTRLRMMGTIENTGTIELGSTGSGTYLHCQDAPLTLTGGGTVVLSDSTANWIYRDGPNGSLVNMDNTIRGGGNLSWSSAPTPITNHGSVIADTPSPLTVNTGAHTFTNDGTLRAENGGTLELEGGLFENVGGVIEALDASKVTLNSITIAGGTLQTSGSGSFESVGTTGTLDGTANAVTSSGLIRVANGRRLRMKGTIENTGTIELGSTGSGTYLQPVDEQMTLTGGGTVVLSNSENNWIYRVGAGSLLNVDNTIRGAGRLSWSSAPTAITNQGSVIADQTERLIIESGSETFNNQGQLSATGAGGLRIEGGFTTSGDVLVSSGSTLTRIGTYTQTAGSTTVNGALSTTTGLQIQGGILKGNGAISGSVVNGGSVQPGESAGILSINSTYSQTPSGEIVIEIGGTMAGTEHDRLAVSGAATLGGVLRVDIIDGYEPVVGDTFTVMTYASKNGAFDAFEATCLGDGRFVQIDVLTTSVVARISDAMAGDLTCDCALTLDDAAALALALVDPDAYLAAYPDCGGLDRADLNGDDVVNGLDIQPFVENYLP